MPSSADQQSEPLGACVNGDGRPVHPPSFVLCKDCFMVLSQKMRELGERLGLDDEELIKPDSQHHGEG